MIQEGDCVLLVGLKRSHLNILQCQSEFVKKSQLKFSCCGDSVWYCTFWI